VTTITFSKLHESIENVSLLVHLIYNQCLDTA